jgi:PAS domain-containing protein
MNSSKRTSFAVFLLLSLASVWGIEYGVAVLFQNLTLSPLISFACLGLLAIFFSPRQILLATPLFALLTYSLVRGAAVFPEIRATSVLMAGVLASWASSQRIRILNRSQEMDTILQSLPVPWILSDGSGVITRASTKALTLLALPQKDLIHSSYFALLSPTEGKGAFIRNYLDVFDSVADPVKIKVSFTNAPRIQMVAMISPVEFPEGKRLLTVLDHS